MRDTTIKRFIHQALREDCGKGDITTQLTVPVGLVGSAIIFAKETGIVCGIPLVREIFRQINPAVHVVACVKEGNQCPKEAAVIRLRGRLRDILLGERVAVNFLSRLSGIATLTNQFVAKTKGTGAAILDTRKTTPNLRSFEKYAVRRGGGKSHRASLSDAILVKDNHLQVMTSLYPARSSHERFSQLVTSVRRKTKKRIEIEVENLLDFKAAIAAKPDIVMLDNFTLSQMKHAVHYRTTYFPHIKLEASGGISLRRVKAIAHTGVDYISVGNLTHSAPALDFSLELRSS